MSLLRVVEIQRRCAAVDYADALAQLDPPATEAEKQYLRDSITRWRNAKRAAAGLYRTNDPDTSRLAAERVTAIGSRADHVGRIVRAVRAHPGRTSAELARLTGLERHEAARRTSDAEHDGSIHKGPPRICTVGGRSAVTWWPRRTRLPVPDCPQPETAWRPAA